jgi:hypothetical protein
VPAPAAKPVAPAPAVKPVAPAPATKPAAPVPPGFAFTDESKGALKVRVTADTDSVRVMAFRNNQLWADTFRKGNTKIFASDTALYFNLSGPDLKVTLHLNNVLLRFSPKIARIIRVAPGGVTYITAEAWQKLAAPRDSVNAR